MTRDLRASRLHPSARLHIGTVGLRTRRLRALLSALGVAIGIAAMVGVLGISESSRADLLAQLDRLGTNLLTVTPGESLSGKTAKLPPAAPAMIGRIDGVDTVSATVDLESVNVYRSELISKLETGGISVKGADPSLLSTLSGSMLSGQFLTEASSRYPVVVLGYAAAKELGITDTSGNVSVVIEGRRFTVVGILQPLPLAPELDRSALIGLPVAQQLFGTDRSPSKIYLRADLNRLDAVRSVLGATASPESPEEVRVSRPSDALAARAAAKTAFTALFLGLGSVALLVGGVGIANVSVISVLERRSEIGLRRALGATRGHIRSQFLTEALLLSGLGGIAGVLLGALIVLGYAATQNWAPYIPPAGLLGGVGASLLIGGVAGLYPAMRAARLAPADALRTT